MPSSVGYKRKYRAEYRNETPLRRRRRALRNKARRSYVKKYGVVAKGYDVDHRKELGKGGGNKLSNLRTLLSSRNRSYPRNKKGRMR